LELAVVEAVGMVVVGLVFGLDFVVAGSVFLLL